MNALRLLADVDDTAGQPAPRLALVPPPPAVELAPLVLLAPLTLSQALALAAEGCAALAAERRRYAAAVLAPGLPVSGVEPLRVACCGRLRGLAHALDEAGETVLAQQWRHLAERVAEGHTSADDDERTAWLLEGLATWERATEPGVGPEVKR